jgi:hypothetical protein
LNYSPCNHPSSIQLYVLCDQELLAVGRVIRAVAKLDEIANLYVERVLKLKDWQSFVIFWKIPTSARLRLAKTIADTLGKSAIATHQDCFGDEGYKAIIKFRNTVAHGMLLGKTDNGHIAFLVQETVSADTDIVFATVNAYDPGSFTAFVELAEATIQFLEERLMLRPLREISTASSSSPSEGSPFKKEPIYLCDPRSRKPGALAGRS